MTVQPKKPSIVPVSSDEMLDYSFKEVTSDKLPEFATKFVPRASPKPQSEEDERVDATIVKLNNNQLQDISGLVAAFATVINCPENLTWIDLSFNNIKKIPNFKKQYRSPTTKQLVLEAACGVV